VLCVWPPLLLAAVARRTAPMLIVGGGVGAAAWAAGLWTETWWEPLRASTIAAVSALVHLVASDVVVDAPNLVVGTSRFSVRILDACAGYEGIGLIWVFLGVYLWMFRRTLRFPRAFLLIPIGTAAIWLANALRLTALIALGTWVSPDVALGGFHTYSGSLLFATLALALASAAGRSRFFSVGASAGRTIDDRIGSERTAAGRERADAVAVYVLPLLVIIATSMLTGALSVGGFDGGYPLRVVAALATLWVLRRGYRALPWTWSWGAVAYGVVAFALWMALEPTQVAPSHELGAALAVLPPAAAALWLAFRVLGSVVTVPIAEELAFRGYLARRLVTADFERLSLRHFSWLAFIGSSVLFGALHSRLIAGTLTGALYFLCFRRRGELADSILAHATTNGLIAAYVITTGNWALWA
jgi:exosortase E/protease (VPEID-CTERM system)